MGWISDILLARFVRKQYEEMSMMPDLPKEQEPSSYRGRNVASEEDLAEINKRAMKKQQNLFEPKLEVKKTYNKEKLDNLETAMQEIREQLQNRSSLNLSDIKIKELEIKIKNLEALNSAKDNHIKVLSNELKKTKDESQQLSPSTKNYIDFLQEQASSHKSVKTTEKAQMKDNSMAVAK